MSQKLVDNLKLMLEINKHGLDDELIKQPSLFFQVGEEYSIAVAERDACKEELATVDAELDGRIRAKLAQKRSGEKGDKVTEAMVKNGIQVHPSHAAAFDTYILAKTRADILQSLKDSFQQRSYMLRELASLYVSSYYDESSVKGTGNTDKLVYDRQRERLAEARARKSNVSD